MSTPTAMLCTGLHCCCLVNKCLWHLAAPATAASATAAAAAATAAGSCSYGLLQPKPQQPEATGCRSERKLSTKESKCVAPRPPAISWDALKVDKFYFTCGFENLGWSFILEGDSRGLYMGMTPVCHHDQAVAMYIHVYSQIHH